MEKEVAVEKLKNILKDAEHKDPALIKEEARKFLETVDASDLVAAEQSLIDEGIDLSNMQHICGAHMEIMDSQLKDNDLIEKLPNTHPIKTLMLEHREILKFLDMLEELNKKVQETSNRGELSEEIKESLQHVAHHLEAAEKHHQREEDVLFPAVEEKGIFGPPEVMRNEHIALRQAKKGLAKLVSEIDRVNYSKFKEKLNEIAHFITTNLREHIFKEDNILYPSALDAIESKEAWKEIQKKCDKIGYCCFSPSYLKR